MVEDKNEKQQFKKSVFMFGEMHYVLLCVKILLDLVYTGTAVTQLFSFYVGCAGTYLHVLQSAPWARGAKANILNEYVHV